MTSVNLQGWDAVNAASFESVNATIVKKGSTPPKFTLSGAPMGNANIDGAWDAWRLVAGSSGGMLAIELPVKTGTASYDGAAAPATLDPATIGDLILDATKLKVTAKPGGQPNGSAFATVGQQAGKYYFELTHDNTSNAGEAVFVGVALNTASNALFTSDPKAYAYGSDGTAVSNGQTVRFAGPGGTTIAGEAWGATGNTVGVAVDLDAGKIWFRGPSGAWQGFQANPVAGTGATFTVDKSVKLYGAVAIRLNDAATVNFGASAFAHPLPPGYARGFSGAARTSVVLDGAIVSGTIRLDSVPGKGTAANLVPARTSTPTSPAATVSAVTLKNGTVADPPIQAAFDAWLKAELTSFSNIFHIIDVGTPVAAGGGVPVPNKFGWLAPTGFAYAAADVPATTPARSILGILTMTDNRTAGGKLAAQVSPAIVANMPTGSNAVLAIGAERVVNQILLPGAQTIADNDKSGTFIVDTAANAVTNKNAMPWRTLKLADGTEVTPQIPAGGMRLAIEGRKIKLSLTGLTFDYPGAVLVGTETVTFGFSQSLYLTFAPRTDGHHVLYPTFKDPDDPTSKDEVTIEDFTIDYNLSPGGQAFATAMLVTGIILSVVTVGLVSMGVAGVVIRSGSAEANTANAAANDVALQGAASSNYGVFRGVLPGYEPVSAVLDGDVSEQVVQKYIPPAVPAPSQTMAANAAIFLAKNALKFAILGTVAGLFDTADWVLFSRQKTKTYGEEDANKVDMRATVETFVEKALEPYNWPGTTTWTLKDVRLDESLMFYGELK